MTLKEIIEDVVEIFWDGAVEEEDVRIFITKIFQQAFDEVRPDPNSDFHIAYHQAIKDYDQNIKNFMGEK